MIRVTCERLDDFLDRALSDEERAAFVTHLENCAACRLAVQQQERLGELFREAVAQLEPIPEGLAEGTARRLRRAARRRFLGRAAGLAAALVLVVVSAWRLGLSPPAEVAPPPAHVDNSPPPAPPPQDPRALVHVDFDPSPAVIAVPVPTESPNVTIVWVYAAFVAGADRNAASADSSSIPERH